MTRRAPIGLAPGVPRDAAGQDAAKYESTNPVVRRLLDRWSARLGDVIGPVGGTVVDVGVGEGLCLERVLVAPGVAPARVVGIEYRHDKARAARDERGIDMVVGDAGMVPLPDGSAELVLCIEVLEHLPLVAPAIAELARITGDADARCVVSVPWEPWFRLGNLARAKNVRRLGNDPEHVGWFTPARLHATLGERFEVVRVVRAFPWLIAEARRPRRAID
jgi:hypothetical protein